MGCPLRCPWCHNPEGISFEPQVMFNPALCIGCGTCRTAPEAECPTEARRKVGRTLEIEDIMQEIEKDRLFYEESGGGVTFSGGEPLAQPRALEELLRRCREEEIRTAVDTSGYADPIIFDRIIALTDHLLIDLKHIDNEKHRAYTGVGLASILRNISSAAESNACVEVRIPVVPGFNDDDVTTSKIDLFLAPMGGIDRVTRLPYHKTGMHKYDQLNRG